MKKRFALTTDGRITVCTASPENVGKGRCNHLEHQLDDESSKDFIDRLKNSYGDKLNMNARNDGTNLVYSYSGSDHRFGKETIIDLDTEIMKKLLESDDPDDVEWTQNAKMSFSEYASSVYYHESENNRIKHEHSGDPEMIKAELLRIDRARKYKHNAAIANMNMLNNLSESLGYGKVYNGVVDTNDPVSRREIRRSIIKYWVLNLRSDIKDLDFDDL